MRWIPWFASGFALGGVTNHFAFQTSHGPRVPWEVAYAVPLVVFLVAWAVLYRTTRP